MSARTVIIGSGPAGLAAALALSRRGIRPLILERLDRPSLKLLASGGGRCNFSNILKICNYSYYYYTTYEYRLQPKTMNKSSKFAVKLPFSNLLNDFILTSATIPQNTEVRELQTPCTLLL